MKHARADYNRIQDPAGLIPENEPVFLIRAQDICAVPTLAKWVDFAKMYNVDTKMIQAVEEQIVEMQVWQKANGGPKIPDMP